MISLYLGFISPPHCPHLSKKRDLKSQNDSFTSWWFFTTHLNQYARQNRIMKLQVYKGGIFLKKLELPPSLISDSPLPPGHRWFFPEVGTRIWPARGVSLVRWPDARWVSLRFRPCRSSRNKPGGLSETKTRRGILILAYPHIILGSTIPVYQKINQGFEHCSNWFQFKFTEFPCHSPRYGMFHYVSICIFLATYKSYHFDSLTVNDTYFSTTIPTSGIWQNIPENFGMEPVNQGKNMWKGWIISKQPIFMISLEDRPLESFANPPPLGPATEDRSPGMGTWMWGLGWKTATVRMLLGFNWRHYRPYRGQN